MSSKASAHSPSYLKKEKNNLFTYVQTDDIKIHPNVDIAVVPTPDPKEKIILVKDVFERPTMVRDLVRSVPVHAEPFFAFPGYRGSLRWGWGELPSFINYIIKTYFTDTEVGYNFYSNVIKPTDKVYKRVLVPHVDQMTYGFSIWMNTPDEIGSSLMPGTAFYKNKELKTCKLDIEKTPDKYDEFEKKYILSAGDNKVDFDSDNIDKNVWERYFISPMQYNSMVLYSGSLFHQAFVKPNFFPTCERFALAGLAK